jgi:hypothetical protein
MDDRVQKQRKRLTIADRLQKFFSALLESFPTDAESALRRAEEQATPRSSENKYYNINKLG